MMHYPAGYIYSCWLWLRLSLLLFWFLRHFLFLLFRNIKITSCALEVWRCEWVICINIIKKFCQISLLLVSLEVLSWSFHVWPFHPLLCCNACVIFSSFVHFPANWKIGQQWRKSPYVSSFLVILPFWENIVSVGIILFSDTCIARFFPFPHFLSGLWLIWSLLDRWTILCLLMMEKLLICLMALFNFGWIWWNFSLISIRF